MKRSTNPGGREGLSAFIVEQGCRWVSLVAMIVASTCGLPLHAQTSGAQTSGAHAGSGAPAGAQARPLPPVETCAERATRARTIAEDRDSGVGRQQELDKMDDELARSPKEREGETPAMLRMLVIGIYGPYGAIPAREIYDEYLQYCKHSDATGL